MRKVLGCLFGCLVATSAQATWTYTTWSMNADQAKAASKGQLVAMSPAEARDRSFEGAPCSLTQTYAAGDLSLRADLCFATTTGRLAKVAVEPVAQSVQACAQVIATLRNRYGGDAVPSHTGATVDFTWRDAPGQTSVLYYATRDGATCHIVYSPLATGSEMGL